MPDELGGRTADELGRRTPDELGGRTADELGGRTADELGRRTPDELGGRTPDELGGRTADELGRRTRYEMGPRTPDELGGRTRDEMKQMAPELRRRRPGLQSDTSPPARAMVSRCSTTVVVLAATEAWDILKPALTDFWARYDPKGAPLAERRLEQTRKRMIQAPRGEAQLRAQEQLTEAWRTRLAELFDNNAGAAGDLSTLLHQVRTALIPSGDTDSPRNHPDPQMRELGRKLQENWKEQLKLETTPSEELTPIVDHTELLGLAKEKDALLAEVQKTDPTYKPEEVAHGRKATKDEIAREEQAVYEEQARRYLKGQCPESIPVGEPFSLLASIVLAGPASAELKPFDVPPEGRDVLLVVHAPGLRLLGHQRMTVHVPTHGDSEPVMFELRADEPGVRRVSVTAWLGGSYLGELLVEITAERGRPPGPHRELRAEIATEPADGAVSLVVRYEPLQNAYRFEFRDEDNPDEVTSSLAYDPGPLVERLVAELDELAKGRSTYNAAQARDYLINTGADLWRELVPERLREQFWDRQHRIRQLTILADRDAVPWELLYPMDRGHDAGFLVQQFPVTRAIFARRPARTLNLRPARFVLPHGSPPEARDEIEAIRRLLDPEHSPGAVISELTPLQDLIGSGDFGVLHFACHNTYDPAAGSSITLDSRFTPKLMTTAVIGQVLARSAPTVFINACRAAGVAATYNRLDGWASRFLEAGAAAFVGSLWAVSDKTAREFAGEFYGHLKAGASLGEAVTLARQAAASEPGDPTWLAYTVYGHPGATIRQPQAYLEEVQRAEPTYSAAEVAHARKLIKDEMAREEQAIYNVAKHLPDR